MPEGGVDKAARGFAIINSLIQLGEARLAPGRSLNNAVRLNRREKSRFAHDWISTARHRWGVGRLTKRGLKPCLSNT